MMRVFAFGRWAFFGAVVCLLPAPAARAQGKLFDTDRREIERVLQQSAVDWSRGDVDAFMGSYEDSPATTFVTAGGLLKGYANIKSHYVARYGSGQKMGSLRFDMLEERGLDADFVLVSGRFMLDRPKGDGGGASGIFTLLFHRGARGWRIRYDHTS